VAESLTKIKGTHEFKFGGDYRYNKDGDILDSLAGGQLNFTNQATGNSLASLLLGWVNEGQALATYHLHSRLDDYAAYFQDNWKATPKLTINYGLRWDLDSPRYTTNNYQNSFNPTEMRE
jgi:outer membrane receptor protein involved in Fe transport